MSNFESRSTRYRFVSTALILVGVAGPATAADSEPAAPLEEARRAQAVRLRELVEAGAADAAKPVVHHPLFVPRGQMTGVPAGNSAAPHVPPARRWPAEAGMEDQDTLRRMKAKQPAPAELERSILAALSAAGERTTPRESSRDARGLPFAAPTGASPDSWTPLFFDVDAGDRTYAGRVTSLARAYDPIQNASVLWAGTVGGGLYKVVIAFPFAFWAPVSYPLPGSPAVGAFLVRPSDGRQILVGTGDYQRYAGTGLYKSTDGGTSWVKKPLPAESSETFRIAADSTDDSRVLLANSEGLFRSSSFGDSWTTSIAGAWVSDVIQDPASPNYWYAAVVHQGVLESSDNGVSFHPFGGECAPIPAPFGRTELAISPSAPNYIFAVVENSGALNGIYRSDNYGCNWVAIDALDTNSWGQAFHALAIEVDPTTPTRLFVGMGGGQWTANATAASPCWVRNSGGTSDCGIGYTFDAGHADMTDFLFDGGLVLIGNDGGAFRYDASANEVIDLGNSLGFMTLQTMTNLQTLSSARQNPNVLVTGLQDNGLVHVLDNDGVEILNGDGGIVSFSPDNVERYYASYGAPYVRAGFHDDAGGLFSLNCGLADDGLNGVVVDPTPGLAASEVYLYTIAADGPSNPFVWFKPPTSTCDWAKAHAAALPLSPSAVDQANDPLTWTLYAWAQADYRVLVSSGAPGGMTWAERTPPGVDPAGADMTLFADRADGRPGTAYYTTAASQPPHAFVTHDKGLSWHEVTGNLPVLTANTFLHEMAGDPHSLDTLFLATEIGIFRTDSAQLDYPIWYRYMEGLPAVTRALNLDVAATGPSSGLVRIGTYGHGFWERAIAETDFLFADGFEAGSTIAWSNDVP